MINKNISKELVELKFPAVVGFSSQQAKNWNVVWLIFMFIKAVIFLLLFGSCKKFLDVNEPNSKIPTSLVFSNDDNANSAVVGMYLDMYKGQGFFASGGEGSLPWVAGLSSDELHNNPSTSAQIIGIEQNELETDNSYIEKLWTSMYRAIYQANAILKGLELSTGLSSDKKNQFKGEALFVRGFSYFYLSNLFGEVPLALTVDYQLNAKLSRTPQVDVYKQIESDLLAADTLLSPDYPTVGRVRPNQFAAKSLLARVYLYKQNWQSAIDYSTIIIANVSQYNLSTDLNTVFLATSREAIWQLKPQDKAEFTNEGSIYNASVVISGNSLSDTIFKSFSATDKRKINWTTSLGRLYLPYKYKLSTLDGQLTTEYSMVFRLAEQYFIRAEARAQLGNITGNNSSESDINAIRHRAGLADTILVELNDAMTIIERERKLELFTEWGHRWLDLKRWRKANQVLGPLKPNWNDTDTLYPVPISEINKNLNLKPQNPGY